MKTPTRKLYLHFSQVYHSEANPLGGPITVIVTSSSSSPGNFGGGLTVIISQWYNRRGILKILNPPNNH